ncbi:xanthine dehydrogenase family protein molybdopterin-binding subunit [Alphaproteobacteria bacterium]|nr:xanthine dehydrogenase family protein molybdopterin-binding subunit [Alphaproteobacteria bacterium]
MTSTNQTIGASLPRVEDHRLLTGAGCFTDDLTMEGQACAAFVRSPHAHADILSIDTVKAVAIPGVLAIYSAADLLAGEVVPFPTDVEVRGLESPNRDGSLMADPPYYTLAQGSTRHVGDPVAMVVAETLADAEEAAHAVEVSYQARQSVTDTGNATASGEPQLWDEAPGNICFDWVAGDKETTTQALDRANHVVSLAIVNNRIITNFLEPRAALAKYDARTGDFLIHTGCQGLYTLQRRLAISLGVDAARIRVISRDVGGGFGSRNVIYPEYVAVLWAARKLGRPVKWTARREEEFQTTSQARDTLLHGTLGLSRDGDFLALRVDSTCNLGAYHTGNGPFTQLRNLTRMLPGVYRTPALYLELIGVFTNTVPISSYRGVGRMEAITLMERLIDKAAAVIGIDRIDLRRRNVIPPEAMPHKTPTGAVYDSGTYAENMVLAMHAANWQAFEARREEASHRDRLRGIGLCNYIEGAGGVPNEYGGLTITGDGIVHLRAGSMSQGQGHETTLRQIVASELGVSVDSIDITTSDTNLIPAGIGTNASRSMVRAGTALVEAARDIIETGRDAAAQILEAAREDIDFTEGEYRVTGTDRAVDLFAVANSAGSIIAENNHKGEETTYPTGCHICEVEIDPETGALYMVAFSVVDDVGRAINPMIVHGQSQGAIAQGVGQALMELGSYDADSGQLLSGSFMDYCLPRADDLPSIDPILNDAPSPTNPLGVKGAGEGGTTGAPGAVMNAVMDALAPIGVKHVDMPATPHTIWKAIQRAKQAG